MTGYFVAYEGSYEDPECKGALGGPYPTLQYARDWVHVLKVAREIMGPTGQKRPLYIIRARARQ